MLTSLALERDRPVTVIYRTSGQATGNGTLAINWTDALDRVVEEQTVAFELADESEVRVALDLR